MSSPRLTADRSAIVEVDATAHHAEILALLVDAPGAESIETEEGIITLTRLATRLPRALSAIVRDFREAREGPPAMRISGLPVDPELPPTPTTMDRRRSLNHTGAAVAGMCASLFGEIHGYAQLDGGALFRNVFPLPTEMWEQSSKGSRSPLLLHTEQTFHPYRPRYLILSCLRGDPQAATMVCPLGALLAATTPEEHLVLAAPRFMTGIDYAFGNTTTEKGNGPVLPIFGGTAAAPALSFDDDLMVGTDAVATEVLDRLRSIAREASVDVRLAPGQMLIIDNDRAAHGRGRFAPRFDGTDRWLLQVKTRVTLPPVGPHRQAGTRVIRTEFAGG